MSCLPYPGVQQTIIWLCIGDRLGVVYRDCPIFPRESVYHEKDTVGGLGGIEYVSAINTRQHVTFMLHVFIFDDHYSDLNLSVLLDVRDRF